MSPADPRLQVRVICAHTGQGGCLTPRGKYQRFPWQWLGDELSVLRAVFMSLHPLIISVLSGTPHWLLPLTHCTFTGPS